MKHRENDWRSKRRASAASIAAALSKVGVGGTAKADEVLGVFFNERGPYPVKRKLRNSGDSAAQGTKEQR